MHGTGTRFVRVELNLFESVLFESGYIYPNWLTKFDIDKVYSISISI